MTGSGLTYVSLGAERAAELAELERASFPTADPAHLYGAAELVALAGDFPEGCFVALDGDRAAAMGLGVRRGFDLGHPLHTIDDVVPHDGTSGHDPEGEWYYGTSIAVRPEYRRRGIGRELYELRKHVCVDLGLSGIVAGGVIPGYAAHKHEMSADEYVASVRAGNLYDPTLSFQLENGFEVPCALPGYIHDPLVDDHAALIVWHNPELVGAS